MNTLPNYMTRDLRGDLQRSASHDGDRFSTADAQAALVYARYIRSQRFAKEMDERRKLHGVTPYGIALPEPSVTGLPLNSRGKTLYESVRRQVDMTRFGADVEHRAIVEKLIAMGAR
jgi:hypothetical protein